MPVGPYGARIPVPAVGALHRAIRALPGGEKSRLVMARMLFVSPDRTFLRGLASRVLELGGAERQGPVSYPGSCLE